MERYKTHSLAVLTCLTINAIDLIRVKEGLKMGRGLDIRIFGEAKTIRIELGLEVFHYF